MANGGSPTQKEGNGFLKPEFVNRARNSISLDLVKEEFIQQQNQMNQNYLLPTTKQGMFELARQIEANEFPPWHYKSMMA